MKYPDTKLKMNQDALYYIPLGGCGMFGANMSLYGYRDSWIMVDCGLGFADGDVPGIEILVPDPAFAAGLGERLQAIILTHAHEDHIGALQYLWPRLRAPLYATPFTAARIRQSLSETGDDARAQLNIVPLGGTVKVDPFEIQFIKMAHSIPESSALAIHVPGIGRVLHTGDWKIDPKPVEGQLTDEQSLRQLGEIGVMAVMGDSTNAMVPGHSGSEHDVRERLTAIFSQHKKKIILTCFSTNVARLRSIYEAAHANGRVVCLEGRSLWAVDEAARKTGYLQGVPPFLTIDEAGYVDDNKVVFVCTGSQGEPRAVINRVSKGEHRDIIINKNDLVIFSSRAIPGNERAVDAIKNRIYEMGAHVLTDRDDKVHVSGHPYRDELKTLYGWVKPLAVVPVHGEQMQLEKHAELAAACGVKTTIIPSNGQVLEISKKGIASVAAVASGILAVEGQRLIPIDHETILMRRRAMYNGNVVVTIVLDRHGELTSDPQMTAFGLLDEQDEKDAKTHQKVISLIKKSLLGLPESSHYNENELKEVIRITVRRFFQAEYERKPQVRIHLVKVS